MNLIRDIKDTLEEFGDSAAQKTALEEAWTKWVIRARQHPVDPKYIQLIKADKFPGYREVPSDVLEDVGYSLDLQLQRKEVDDAWSGSDDSDEDEDEDDYDSDDYDSEAGEETLTKNEIEYRMIQSGLQRHKEQVDKGAAKPPVPVQKVVTKTKPRTTAAPKSLTVKQLRAQAKAKGCTGYWKMSKAELQDWLKTCTTKKKAPAKKLVPAKALAKSLTVVQLRALAKERGCVGYTTKKKAELEAWLKTCARPKKAPAQNKAPAKTRATKKNVRAKVGFENLTVPELKAKAKDRNFSNYSSLRHSELVAMLRRKRSPAKRNPASKKRRSATSCGSYKNKADRKRIIIRTARGACYVENQKKRKVYLT